MLCVRERYVRDPLEYNVCQSFVQPMKALMLQELQCVRMETYIDNSSVHLFGGTLPSGYFCGVVCYERLSRQFPTLFHRQPLLRYCFDKYDNCGAYSRLSQQQRLYSLLEFSQWLGMAGRLVGTGYIYQLDNGELAYNINTNTFEKEHLDYEINSKGEDDEPVLDHSPKESTRLFLRQLEEYAEVAVKIGVNWYESHNSAKSRVYQGAFPVLIHAPNLPEKWTASELHSVFHTSQIRLLPGHNPFVFSSEPIKCSLQVCPFTHWDHVDGDYCVVCEYDEIDQWPSCEFLYNMVLNENVKYILTGDDWRLEFLALVYLEMINIGMNMSTSVMVALFACIVFVKAT
ncbi:hypothetical protein THRCLA_22896 [Thraustotheca clavata]|uniref:Uncharacterized protein n=1 Tax=Thraustotheca clavata TaxID=74557 RepID=A0A1V9YR49_9STRA|nr:hypothetical protein THRCLA_22896 [Thraustotheca clavata]